MHIQPLIVFGAAVVAGTALIRLSAKRPARSAYLETTLGALLCSALLLLGASLPHL